VICSNGDLSGAKFSKQTGWWENFVDSLRQVSRMQRIERRHGLPEDKEIKQLT